MQHPAELAVHAFLGKAVKGEAEMSKEVIAQVASDVSAALNKQFNGGKRGSFALRMSNIGRPTCQLWFEKNKPEVAAPRSNNFLMNMIIGDITEAVFKGVLRGAGISFDDNARVTLKLDGREVSGEYDMVLDGRVDDIKSASPWSYENKFKDAVTLSKGDSFGYVSQLIGYAEAASKEVGGWWVVNKATGEFKYVPADDLSKEDILENIKRVYDYISKDMPFERCFEDEEETHYKKPTGNRKLCKSCSFCDYKKSCWPNLQTIESIPSTAKTKPYVDYTYVA